ncbi:cyclin N-terminal domain-containing protein 1 isoform X2 [Xylocopa sonorina]|uniref:cyclin N-terminal domain-containing protein 1 isoform X2 n=1 Tax=Xylocopa sonorina TaxID=1818115 RepID=UPI00403A9ED9
MIIVFKEKNSNENIRKQMDFDTAYIEPLLDDWLERLRSVITTEENLIKAKHEFYMPFVVINTIFKITEHLDLGPDTRYVAIHLYDKFMCNYFWEVYKNTDQAENSWTEVCRKISSQSKLYLMSCLQLASKMDSHSRNLKISQVLNILQWIDKESEYTHSTIFLSEYKVFKTVGFRMPFCTPLNCIEVLLTATGLMDTPNIQELAISLLDLVYLQREKLCSHLQCLIQENVVKTQEEWRNFMTLESNVLYLGASIVLCGTFFLCIDGEMSNVIALKLSQLIDVEMSDIWNMANILLVMAIQE